MLDHVPLVQAFIWYAAIATRYDMIPAGPTYGMQVMLEAVEKAERLEAKRKRRRKSARRVR